MPAKLFRFESSSIADDLTAYNLSSDKNSFISIVNSLIKFLSFLYKSKKLLFTHLNGGINNFEFFLK